MSTEEPVLETVPTEEAKEEEEPKPQEKKKKQRVKRTRTKTPTTTPTKKRRATRKYHPALWCLEVDTERYHLAHANDGKGEKQDENYIRLPISENAFRFPANKIIHVAVHSSLREKPIELKCFDLMNNSFCTEDKKLILITQTNTRGGPHPQWLKPVELLADPSLLHSDDPALAVDTPV